MRTLELNNKYEGYVQLLDDEKLIVKLNCLCPSFSGFVKDKHGNVKSIKSKIKRIGKFSDIKYFSEPCVHLKPVVDALIRQGYTLKIPKNAIGIEKLTPKLREMILKRADYECENGNDQCSGPLEIHRITPATHGGLYSMSNCMVLCKYHHNLRNTYLWRNH